MTTSSRRLLSRLYHDLAELKDEPYPGVTVFTEDADIRRFCLVLTPSSGPWKDLALHFDVQLPLDWPASPPLVSSSVDIEHPNLLGSYVCCDLLKAHVYAEAGYNGGYTPALTLRGLFLQFQTFFSSTKVDQDYGGTIDIGDSLVNVYYLESDFKNRPFKLGICLVCDYKPCYCRAEQHRQADFEKLWNSNASLESIINDSGLSRDSHVLHKVKRMKTSAGKLHRFEYRNPRWTTTYKSIVGWKCRKCPYGSEELPHYQAVPLSGLMDVDNLNIGPSCASPTACHLAILNDDTLAELASHLTSESLLSLAEAYPRFRQVSESLHILLQRELRCFFLRTSLRDSTLGIGIAFDAKSRMLSSAFEWICEEAFVSHKVRKSIEKQHFEFFLPLAFSRYHFERVQNSIWSRLDVIDSAIRQNETTSNNKGRRNITSIVPPVRKPYDSVRVIFKMMNNTVVSLMKSCDDVLGSSPTSSKKTLLRASEKAVISYCHLFHLLLCLCRSAPGVLHDATAHIRRFLSSPSSRDKKHVPDIGEFIVSITLALVVPPSSEDVPIAWNALSGPFLEEAITRNVRWVLKESPLLEVMETGVSDYRLKTTFTSSKTSLRLMMFQMTFLSMFIEEYASDISPLDDNYGFPQKELPERMVQVIKEIYKVDAWPEFFRRVRYAKGSTFTKEQFCGLLRQAVQRSAEKGYHTPTRGTAFQVLCGRRAALEKHCK